MGFFSKKNHCPICGMEGFDGRICSYCGQGKQSQAPAKLQDLDRFRSTPVQKPVSTPAVSVTIPAKQPVHPPVVVASPVASRSPQPICKLRSQAGAPKKQGATGILFFVFLYVWLTHVMVVLRSLSDPQGNVSWNLDRWLTGVIVYFVFLVLLSIKKTFQRWIVIVVFEVSAIIFFIKPIVAPFKYQIQTQDALGHMSTKLYTASLTSEDHLYFLITGAVLMMINGILLMMQIRKMQLKKQAATNGKGGVRV